MQPAITSTPNPEERALGLYDHMGVYAPFVWVMDWLMVSVLRLGLRAGFISPEFLMPARPKIRPRIFYRNRQLRRARKACLRRAHRSMLRRGELLASGDYLPRAYAYYDFIDRMDKTITRAQFNEHYLRGTNISRVQIYGMDFAHAITGYVPEVAAALSMALANAVERAGGFVLSLGVPADPAPPYKINMSSMNIDRLRNCRRAAKGTWGNGNPRLNTL